MSSLSNLYHTLIVKNLKNKPMQNMFLIEGFKSLLLQNKFCHIFQIISQMPPKMFQSYELWKNYFQLIKASQDKA